MPGPIDCHWYAPVHLVDGNPLDDQKTLANTVDSLTLVMKDGCVHRNTLGRAPVRCVHRPLGRAASGVSLRRTVVG